MIELNQQRRDLLASRRNLLVLGGPGAGKTTIALLKADHEAQQPALKKGQQLLFLSFARATIARVAQQAGKLVGKECRERLEINTYHGFMWKLLRSHGYLLRAGSRLQILTPPQAAVRLATIKERQARVAEIERLFAAENILHFDLFATAACDLLTRSKALRRIICDAYPIVILDEFQDTNAKEWEFIKALGAASRLMALADAEQRIYEFRGADPRRIGEFANTFDPETFDFGNENHRSDGTDIAVFGNDLLRGTNRGKAYTDVAVKRYGFYRGRDPLFPLKCTILERMRKLIQANPLAWSMAILVPTKKLMTQVSDYLDSTTDRFPSISHDVALDSEAPALAAVLIGSLLEGGPTSAEIAQRLISDLCQHICGRKGSNAPSQGELDLVGALGGFLESGQVRGPKRKQIVEGARRIAEARAASLLTGDPAQDWLAMRSLLANAGVEVYSQVVEDSRFLRLLHKGAIFRSRLSELWRANGCYDGAAAAVKDALLQEHFAASVRDWRGIHVMTIHKSKGKEFTEVVIFEGRHQGRIVSANAGEGAVAQAKLALRVAVTRAQKRATVLTPEGDSCRFL